jgi:electron transfer flavoprotein beta subunit
VNIVVCVKHTPVSTADKRLDDDLLLDRESVDSAVNTYDEPAIEEGLRLIEAHGGTITFLGMGPDEAVDSLRKALAMAGEADARSVLISDDGLRGSDISGTALVLSAALKKLRPDLILLGMRSDDAGTGVLAGAVAQHLDLPLLTHANQITIEGTTIRTQRRLSDGYIVQESVLPVVLGVTDAINTPRYPSLKGIMGAKKKPFTKWDLDDLEIVADSVGMLGARTRVLLAVSPPPRAKGEVVQDKGDGAERILSFLAERKLV